MTKAPTEEDLMAFVDGELDTAATASLLEHLNQSPELRNRLAIYTESRDLLEKLYVGRAAEPVPEQLLNVIHNSTAETRDSWLKGIRLRIAEMSNSVFGDLRSFQLPQMATVGALMLVAGVFVGQSATGVPNVEGNTPATIQTVQIGPIESDSPLGMALAKTATGETFNLSQGDNQSRQQFKAVLTFLSKAQRPCRQFSIASAADSSVNAIACFDADNTWHVVTAARFENSKQPAIGYQRAGGPGGPEIDATLKRLMQDIPMDLDEEQRFIQSKWRTTERAKK